MELNWTSFPPAAEKDRLLLYDLYKRVLGGDHRSIFAPTAAPPNSETSMVANAAYLKRQATDTPYVVLNYCKTVATTFASKMFGKAPEYRVAGEHDIAQERLGKIIINNTLNNTNIEQAITSVALGGCVYRVRWGQMRNWAEAMPIIESIPPKNFFAITPLDNIKDILAGVLAFPFDFDGEQYLKVEIHEPYQVTHELYRLSGEGLGNSIPFESVPAFSALLASATAHDNITQDGNRIIEYTDYPGLLVEYVPNFVMTDEYYGHSDYDHLLSIQHDINETNTGILRVILKHIDPKLVVPPGTLQYDERSSKWYVIKEDMEVVEVPENVGSVLPRYVTWDAQLGAARANVEALFEAFMIIADISLPMLGITKYGTAESAQAIELKMTQTTDAVHRKRMYFDTALKNILYAAQWLDVHYGGQKYTPLEVNITWPSPVPLDKVTETDMHAKRVDSGLESQQTAIKAVQGLEGEALDAEMEQIRLEAAARSSVSLGVADPFADTEPDDGDTA